MFGFFGLFSSGLWLGFGTGLRKILKSPRAVRAVNIVMAVLLVLSIWPVIADSFR